MKYLSRPVISRNQRGSVAIEAALTMGFILIPLLCFVLFFGRYFWYYTIAQKTAHDAALYLATAPLADTTSKQASEIAEMIINDGLGDIDQTTRSESGYATYCLFATPYPGVVSPSLCSDGRPVAVKAQISMKVSDPFLSPITSSVIGYEGLPIKAGVTLPYVGR